MRVVVLHGYVAPDAPEDEQDVLRQVEQVCLALGSLGYESFTVPFTLDTKSVVEALQELRPGFVFNLVESVEGKGKLIHLAPSVLDHLGLPYTGAATEAFFLSSNKLLSKNLFQKSGIPTPPWVTSEEIGRDAVPFGPPYIIKSVWEHASIGLDEDSVIHERRRLRKELDLREASCPGTWFAESYIDGREFNLSLLGPGGAPEVLPPAEIRFVGYPEGKPRVVGYTAKWEKESFEYRNTSRSFVFSDQDRPLLRRLADLAVECWNLFGLRGYGRVDFRVDASGKPWVLEVNANPCLTPEGGFASAAEQGGLAYDRLVQRIIECSMPPPAMALPRDHTGSSADPGGSWKHQQDCRS